MERLEFLLGRVLSDLEILGRDIDAMFHRYRDLLRKSWKKYRRSKRKSARYKWADELAFWADEIFIDIYNHADDIKFYHGEDVYDMVYDEALRLKEVAEYIAYSEWQKKVA